MYITVTCFYVISFFLRNGITILFLFFFPGRTVSSLSNRKATQKNYWNRLIIAKVISMWAVYVDYLCPEITLSHYCLFHSLFLAVYQLIISLLLNLLKNVLKSFQSWSRRRYIHTYDFATVEINRYKNGLTSKRKSNSLNKVSP